MSAITPLRFTGISTFSEDFQAILTRAVQIASLPIQQLQNQENTLITRKQSVTALNANVESLTDAVRSLGEIGRTRSLTVTSSNTTRVSVLNNGVATATSYAITEITSVAKAASETTSAGFATADSTPVDADGQLELVVGDQTYAIDLSASGNTLENLRNAVNSSGAGVTATILNTGSNNYLSITANAPGAKALKLRDTAGDDGSNLLTGTNQGANATFKLNGLLVDRPDNVIADVIPGLTFTILDKTAVDETVNLNAVSSRGSIATALGALVTAYNATVDKVNTQIGEQAGYLSGDPIIGQVSRTLRQLTGYSGSGSGSVKSLTDLGIELDRKGKMSFNSTKFYSLPSAVIEEAFQFLGSESTGFGSVSRSLDQLSNPVTGLFRLQQNNYDAADLRIQKQVSELTVRIQNMQVSLAAKLQQADALLSGLQSQQSQLESSLKSVNFVAYGKQ